MDRQIERQEQSGTGLIVTLLFIVIAVIATVVFVISGLEEKIPIRIGHYKTSVRWYQAQQAHLIFDNPHEPCDFYECKGSNSELKICKGVVDGVVVWAMSWVYNNGICYKEGTCWIQKKPRKVENYIKSHGCTVRGGQ